MAMLQRLHDDLELPLPQAASEAYYATLHQYHGWITSAAFIVALKASPSPCHSLLLWACSAALPGARRTFHAGMALVLHKGVGCPGTSVYSQAGAMLGRGVLTGCAP